MSRRPSRQLQLRGLVRAGVSTTVARAQTEFPGGEAVLRRKGDRWLGAPLSCRGAIRLACRSCGYNQTLSYRCEGSCRTCPFDSRAQARSIVKLVPRVPLRHWVLKLPNWLRIRVADDDAGLRRIVRAFVAELFAHLRRTPVATDATQTECGAASFVHRAGSALGLDIHIHVLLLDGVYGVREDGRPARFFPEPIEPSAAEVTAIAARVLAQARRDRQIDPDAGGSPVERHMASAAVGQRAALGPRAGAAARRVRLGEPEFPSATTGVVGGHSGMEVFAGPPVAPDERVALIRLANYVVRPPLDPRNAEPLSDGRIRYRLAHPFTDGTTHVEFSADELGERLLALIPNGPARRMGWHGVLAPRAAKRWQVRPAQLGLAGITLEATSRASRPATKLEASGGPPLQQPCPRCPGRLEPVALEECSDALGLAKSSASSLT